jgi:phosphoglucomutase
MYDEKHILARYAQWAKMDLADADLSNELETIKDNREAITDRFYKDLEFGTGGLRGVIGAGTNRMNIYTVARVTQGYAAHINGAFAHPSVAIAYDSRKKSDLFAQIAAGVFAANGIQVHIFRELMPTPVLSFAVRQLKCAGGIMVTASHNPAQYNGYKVYGSDGGQMTLETSAAVLAEIERTDIFGGVKAMPFEEGLAKGIIRYIENEVLDAYIASVSALSLHTDIAKNMPIVYTPLNGTGLKPVLRAFSENGFSNVIVVPEQKDPDGNFTTCPYPNPEMKEALAKGLECAKKNGSALLLATDPDCDRVGTAVKNGDGYELMTGNQIGILLFDYICKSRVSLGRMPRNPVTVKTVVSTRMIEKIAAQYGVQVIDVLTGFKFIGEQISLLEEKGEAERYIFGFEESYGYLTGTHVRDKDAVNGCLLIAEMFAYYHQNGRTLHGVLNELYARYGYHREALDNFTFEGHEGFIIMETIMADLRNRTAGVVCGKKLVRVSDYTAETVRDLISGKTTATGLPSSDVVKFEYEDDVTVIVRPSGTEPKLKVYYLIKAENALTADDLVRRFRDHFDGYIKSYKG